MPDTGHMNWLTARSSARGGQSVCRVNWVDRYIYFANYLYWLQLYDPVTKLLGLTRVIQADDFSIPEFQAIDWIIYGMAAPPPPDQWTYPVATLDHLLTESGDAITTETGDPILQ